MLDTGTHSGMMVDPGHNRPKGFGFMCDQEGVNGWPKQE